MRPMSIYVTGTDTGVGKTVASCALLHAMRARGLRAVGMKPVASGCERTTQGWRNDDALALLTASDPRPDYDDLNPYPLPLATAPQIAAREAGTVVELGPLVAAHARLLTMSDVVVVEGVGGWAAPLADALDQVELVRALNASVVLVVGLRLGCLSHARLTTRAIMADGCRCAGWIASAIDPDIEHGDEYLGLLRDALSAPCLGVLAYTQAPEPARLAAGLALPTSLL